MKIALLAPYLPPANDGVGDHADRLAQTLVAAGHDVTVISVGEALPAMGYTLELVGRKWGPFATTRAIVALHRHRVEAVIVEYTPFLYGGRSIAALAVLLAARLLRVRSAIVVHEAFYKTGSAAVRSTVKGKLLRMRDAATIRCADVVAVPSATRRAEVLSQLAVVKDRIVIVPIAANVEPPASYRHCAGALKTIVSFGVVMPRRRLEHAVRAVAQMIALGEDIRLDIIGRTHDSAYAKLITELAAERGIADRVNFVGELEPQQISIALSRAAVAIHAAREGSVRSSGSLLALLSHGVPTIALRTPYDDEIFADAVRFVDDQSSSLVAALLALTTETRASNELTAAGVRCYGANFGWPIAADRLQLALRHSTPPALRQT
jgi:glycosyltransferase involved in cell wall biosynthesis